MSAIVFSVLTITYDSPLLMIILNYIFIVMAVIGTMIKMNGNLLDDKHTLLNASKLVSFSI